MLSVLDRISRFQRRLHKALSHTNFAGPQLRRARFMVGFLSAAELFVCDLSSQVMNDRQKRVSRLTRILLLGARPSTVGVQDGLMVARV